MPTNSGAGGGGGEGPQRSHLLEDIKAAAAADPESAYRRGGYTGALKKVGPHLVGLCPFHDDTTPSFKVTVGGDGEHVGTWYCHGACKEGGSVVDFYLRAQGAPKLTRALVLELGELLGLAVGEDGAGGGEPEATYDYHDAEGKVVFQVCRFPGKDFRQRRPDGEGGWIWNVQGVKRVLYRLPLLLGKPDALVLVCEGEKDADRVNDPGADPWGAEDVVGTTCSGGAGKWRPEHTAPLAGRDVAIPPDNDEAGRKHGEGVAAAIAGTARFVKVVSLPDLPEGGDVSDYLAAGHSLADLLSVVAETPAWKPSEQPSAEREAGEKPKRSQADRLVELVEASTVELFHDQFAEPYARGEVGGHREIWRLGSKVKRCQRWLGSAMWEAERKVPGPQAITGALNVLEAKAGAGPGIELHNRVAADEGAIYYDMSDEKWRAVKVTPEGWSVVEDPPPLFRRYMHQEPQVEPDPAGDLTDLLGFVNLRDGADQLLLLVYVVSCMVPDYPHAIPVVIGPQGSAKTSLLRMVRKIIDPSVVEVMSFPYEKVELMQMLAHQWAPYFDNVSRLPTWLSDALCSASTGLGFPKRQLWTDEEDIIFRIKHCVGLTGVNAAPTQSDLLDRCLLFKLPSIAEGERRTEKELWADFERARAGLVGGALNALSRAMELLPSVGAPRAPRMADFARWGCAIARGLGSSEEAFITAYGADISKRHEEAVSASPVGELVVALVEERRIWEGTPSELLHALSSLAMVHQVSTKEKSWPKVAHVLTRRLNEIAPNLEAMGIRVTVTHERMKRIVRLERGEEA